MRSVSEAEGREENIILKLCFVPDCINIDILLSFLPSLNGKQELPSKLKFKGDKQWTTKTAFMMPEA
jgi:hypothetical protein